MFCIDNPSKDPVVYLCVRATLKGRTMDFVFNMRRVSVIGHKRLDLPNHDIEDVPSSRPREEGVSTSWQKPRLCQVSPLLNSHV